MCAEPEGGPGRDAVLWLEEEKGVGKEMIIERLEMGCVVSGESDGTHCQASRQP